MRILFNEDENDDIPSLLAFLEGVALNDEGKKLSINVEKVISIVKMMRQDFPHRAGLDQASVFKKVANFVCYFVAEKPIQSDLVTLKNVPEELAKIPNYANTLVAMLVAFACLHGAIIHKKDGTETRLSNPIRLSRHSFIDLVDALSRATPSTHFQMVAVLFEQLAYKSNPECQYDQEEWGNG